MKVVLYEAAEPLRPSQRFIAFLADDSGLLPVRFMADSAGSARERAMAFWSDEIAKEEARKAAGKALAAKYNRPRVTA